MKLLLDTHTFIWFVFNAPELPAPTRDLMLRSKELRDGLDTRMSRINSRFHHRRHRGSTEIHRKILCETL